ncbi:MAG: formate dehydrogenase accessory sulfurtransferase FdhD [Pseudomonadota bacterium]
MARDAMAGGATWRVPEELPVAFVYNRRNYAVMLATPADMDDFSIGFSLTEQVVSHVNEIKSVDIHQTDRGIELHISIDDERLERLDIQQRRRNLVGRAGCGVCGLENAETFFEKLPQVSKSPAVLDTKALVGALLNIEKFQPLNASTRSAHAAAWVDPAGTIQFAREDVGRHNALDKLLGAGVRDGVDFRQGFLLMSSRCSYEIVEKAARLGVPAIASISAPTAFAIRKAAEANISLYARSGETFALVNG